MNSLSSTLCNDTTLMKSTTHRPNLFKINLHRNITVLKPLVCSGRTEVPLGIGLLRFPIKTNVAARFNVHRLAHLYSLHCPVVSALYPCVPEILLELVPWHLSAQHDGRIMRYISKVHR